MNSAAFNELSRVLELLCRATNPPHAAGVRPVMPKDVGLTDFGLDASDPRLAYRYRRGYCRTDADAAQPIVPAGATSALIWPYGAMPAAPAYAFCEIQPGEFAIGDEFGKVLIFQRAPRGRWECATVIDAHADAVMDIAALPGGGFVSAGRDRTVRVFDADERGAWRQTSKFESHQDTVNAVCVLDDGTLVSGSRDQTVKFYRHSTVGPWSPIASFRGRGQVTSLAAMGNDDVAAAFASGPPLLLRARGEEVVTVQTLSGIGSAFRVARWDKDRLIAADTKGWLTWRRPAAGAPLVQATPYVAFTSGQLLSLCPLDGQTLAAWTNDGNARIWRVGANGFERELAVLPASAAGLAHVAALADGRAVISDSGRIAVAGESAGSTPDSTGNWRVEEEIARYSAGITALAALDETQFVIAQEGLGLVLLRRSADNAAAWQAEAIDATVTGVGAVAVADATRFALLLPYGAVRVYSRDEPSAWRSEDLPVPAGARLSLAWSGPEFLAIARNDGRNPQDTGVLVWRRAAGTRFTQIGDVSLEGRGPTCMAGNGRREFAVVLEDPPSIALIGASNAGRWEAKAFIRDLPAAVTSIHWIDDRSFVVGLVNGGIRGYRLKQDFRPAPRRDDRLIEEYVPFGEFAWGGGQPVHVALMADFRVALCSTRGQLGVANITVKDVAPELYAPQEVAWAGPRAPIRRVDGVGGSTLIAADALYAFDDPVGAARALRRVIVTAQAVIVQLLTDDGLVRSARITRRPDATGNAPAWLTELVDGKQMPVDPLLHPYAAFVDGGGRLREVGEFPAQLDWADDGRTLVLTDSALL